MVVFLAFWKDIGVSRVILERKPQIRGPQFVTQVGFMKNIELKIELSGHFSIHLSSPCTTRCYTLRGPECLDSIPDHQKHEGFVTSGLHPLKKVPVLGLILQNSRYSIGHILSTLSFLSLQGTIHYRYSLLAGQNVGHWPWGGTPLEVSTLAVATARWQSGRFLVAG